MRSLPLALYVVIGCFALVSTGFAETIRVGIGLSKPPYIIQEKNAGAEYEVVDRALALSGYDMQARYMPLLRISHELNAGSIDAGMNMRAHMEIDGFFSDVVMNYQNYAITRADNGIYLKELGDLSDKRVVAFHNAHRLLGDTFGKAIGKNDKYSEIANQALQVRMLAAGRVDVVIADFRIFLHFKKQMEHDLKKSFDVTFHRLFPPTPYRLAFRSRLVRDEFDRGLEVLRKTGEYDHIIAKYISPDDVKKLTE